MNESLVELESTDKQYQPSTKEQDLISWLTELTTPWREYRDNNFKNRWEEYYRLWRGIFKDSDKTRKSERSKLIVPALQQAIETVVAEIEEAVFGNGKFFDISQDVLDKANDKQKVLLEKLRKRLNEDMMDANIPSQCSSTFLLGALYGTGIGKISMEQVEEYMLNDQLQLEETERLQVILTPVDPLEFLVDPVASCIDESIGCVHELIVPKSEVLKKMTDGVYKKIHLGQYEKENMSENDPSTSGVDKVRIFEYHGLVPESYLSVEVEEGEEFEDLTPEIKKGDDNGIDITNDRLVEAIVVIANESSVLKAVANPLPRADRAFIAYQHDTVPNRFWGRGISEKGYNPQKALDAELRARIDAMAFAVHPMMAMDATRMPRGTSFTVSPGKTILTQGDPSSVFMPLKFGGVNAETFPQSQALERMIQMGTGAVDTASNGAGPIGTTLGGMSMLASASIKRTKRTLANIERNFISPLVHKVAWRYMFFDKERYPIPDMKFQVQASLGMMAKELEQNQYANLMKTVPADSPAYWLLLQGVYENSSISNKDEMMPVIKQMMERALNPPPPQPDAMVEVTKMDIESRERTAMAKLKLDALKIRGDLLKMQSDVQLAEAKGANYDADSVLKLAQAESQAVDAEIKALIQEVDSLHREKSTKEEMINESRIDNAPTE